MNRKLGIDYGKKRIGIAVSDPLGYTTQPLEVIGNDKRMFEKILELCEKYSVSEIIVGMPKTLKGETSFAADDVQKFVDVLKRRVNIPVICFDERLTTKIAQGKLAEMGVKGKKNKIIIDKIAAAGILQDYMDFEGSKRKL